MHTRRMRKGEWLVLDTPEGVRVRVTLRRQANGRYKMLVDAPKCVKISSDSLDPPDRIGKNSR